MLRASWKNENGAGQSKRLFYILCNPVLKRGSASLKEYFFATLLLQTIIITITGVLVCFQ